MVEEMTMPQLLAEKAATQKDTVALRQKHLGIWNEVSWSQYLKTVEQLAAALSFEYNFKKGETVALIGENRPQWLYSQLAVQSLGGISAGIYQDSLPQQLIYYLNDCQARIVIVEGQEQVDKLIEIIEQVPLLKHIIYYDNQGMRHYKDQMLQDFNELIKKGGALVADHPSFYKEEVGLLSSEDTAIIAYSASATGNPKGIRLSHRTLIAAGRGLEAVDQMSKTDDYFSFLPLSWIHEQVMSVAIPLITGTAVNFPEKPHTVLLDLREIGPHTFLAPPRVYQTLYSNFTTRIQGTSWFKMKVYKSFKFYGDKIARAKLQNKPVSAFDKLMYGLGDFLVFSAIRDHMGLARIKRAYIAGATLEPATFSFFHSIGVNLKQTYGGTELGGIAVVQRDNDIQLNSVGTPISETEVKIGAEGEIFLRNVAVFSENETPKKSWVSEEGWISLGDCGGLNEAGQLYVLDRKEDVITLTNGKTVYPSLIENQLKASPFIQEAICFGDERPFLSAILNIDMNSVGKWADKNRIVYTNYSDLSRHPEVIQFIEKEVRHATAQLPAEVALSKFVILPKQLSADDNELTRTLKIRRKFIKEKYSSVIQDFYRGPQELPKTGFLPEDEERDLHTIHLETVR